MDPKNNDILDFVKSKLPPEKHTDTKAAPPAEPKPEPTPEPKQTATPAPAAAPTATPTPEPNTPATPAPEDDDLQLSPFSRDLLEDTPEPKPTEKKDDTTPPEEDELDKVTLPEKASVEAKDAFKKVNAQRAQLKKDLKALQAEKAALEEKLKSGPAPEEVTTKLTTLEEENKTLAQKFEEAQKKLALLDIKSTDHWAETIDKPLKVIGEKMGKLVTKYNLDPATLRQALSSDDTDALATIMQDAGVNRFDEQEMAKLRAEYIDIRLRKKSLTDESGQARQIMEEAHKKQQAEQVEAVRRTYEDTRKVVSESIKQAFAPYLKEVKGEDKWNETVRATLNMMDTVDPSTLGPKDLAQMLPMAAVAPVLAGVVESLKKDLAAVTARYKKLAKLNPSPTPAGPSTAPKVDTAKSDDPLTFVREQRARKGY